MNDHVVNLVKELSRGPCGCEYNMGSATSGYVEFDGTKHPGTFDRGPRTYFCTRCKARQALEEDGVPYEKDDRYFPDFARWGKLKIDAEPMILGTVITGTITFGPTGVNWGP